MRRIILTFPTPAENLALDEALLEWAEAENPAWEFVRLWESAEPIVVIGRSTRVSQEVNEVACAERGIPILRRSSGGAAIVTGPGCLMYAVVLSYDLRPELRDIGKAHQFVLGRLAASLRKIEMPVEQAGTSDLVIAECELRSADSGGVSRVVRDPGRGGGPPGSPPSAIRNSRVRKVSGNSLRAKRTHFLYHGTLLYDFDLSLIATCLKMPPRQPDYRAARSHHDFVTNLPASRAALENAVLTAWPTASDLCDWPKSYVESLVAERFGQASWNREFV